jgi:arylsulfatase A-like enzyme
MRSSFLPTVLLFVASLLSLPAADSRAPNIIFLLADDIGIDWIGSYGADFPTPNIDRLAASGVRFQTAWTNPICTPTRVMMLTGQYPGRTGWTEHYDVPRWGGAGLIPEKFPTWPQLLRAKGYATAIVGKWQINDLRPEPDILARHGFEKHCVWPGVEAGNPPTEHRYWDAYLQTDGVRQIHRDAYGPDVTQAYALNFIRQNRDRPFLLYYPAIAVHALNEPIPPDRANPPKGEAALYARSVTYLDQQVGELLDELDRLKLTANTVIIFAGDNGSSTGGRMHKAAVPAGKGRTNERGVQVPLIVRAPMLGVGGRTTEALADFSDIFPTMLELAGVPTPAKLRPDGRSWVPLLRGDTTYSPRPWIYAQRDTSRTARDARFKLDTEGGFFEVAVDPDQLKPVSPTRDAAAAAAHAKLVSVLASIPATSTEPPFPGYTPDRMRGEGRKQNRK